MVTINVHMIDHKVLKLFTTKTIETIYVLQYQLHEYKSGFCLNRNYNLNRNLLSIEISPILETESSLIREIKNKNFYKLIDKCLRFKFKYKGIQILQRKKDTRIFLGICKSLEPILLKRNKERIKGLCTYNL